MWQCSICGEFTADTRERLVNHFGQCNGNDPNFHIVCGLDSCTTSFKKYFSWRKHLTHVAIRHMQNVRLQTEFPHKY